MMKWPRSIHATKKKAAHLPSLSIPFHIALYQSLPVSISNTSKNEFPNESKFFRWPAKPSPPPKICMPSTEKINTKRNASRRKSSMPLRPRDMFSMSCRMRLYWRRNLTDRSTRTRRNARSTDMDDCDDSISTMDTITMAASNKFIRSLQYASAPRPKTLSTISSANASVRNTLICCSKSKRFWSIPWYSDASVTVFATMSSVTNRSNHLLVTSALSGFW